MSLLQKAVYLFCAGAVVYALVMIVTNWWVCDDAFISFRYAKHLAEGHGLIYNVGERVEGYSNFLWTVLLSAGMKAGLDPVPFSLVLGVLSFVAVLVAMAAISRRLFGGAEGGELFLPLTSILLLLHHDMQVFTTSGLETMFVTSLVMWGVYRLLSAEESGGYLQGGFLFTLAALARPDGLLFSFMGGVFVLVMERKWRPALIYAIPTLLLYVPYFIWRYSYYGFLFPNTYYAKSGDLSYWSQGWEYLKIYFESYYLLFLALPAIVVVVLLRSSGRIRERSIVWRAVLLTLCLVVPYVLYIVKVGGDFMFARFWVVITPLLLLLVEILIRLVFRKSELAVVATIFAALLIFFRVDLYAGEPKGQISGIANEPAYYPSTHYQEAREQGERLKRYLDGLDVQVAFRGQHAMQVYYSEVPVAIEAATGLTDAYIAHLPLTKRGRPGHEKTAPLEYLNSRGVEFMLVGIGAPGSLADSLTQISFGGYMARILQYNGKVMERLKAYPDVRFMDAPAFIDDWIRQLPYMPKETAENSLAFFEDYYFKPTGDPEREARFRAALGK